MAYSSTAVVARPQSGHLSFCPQEQSYQAACFGPTVPTGRPFCGQWQSSVQYSASTRKIPECGGESTVQRAGQVIFASDPNRQVGHQQGDEEGYYRRFSFNCSEEPVATMLRPLPQAPTSCPQLDTPVQRSQLRPSQTSSFHQRPIEYSLPSQQPSSALRSSFSSLSCLPSKCVDHPTPLRRRSESDLSSSTCASRQQAVGHFAPYSLERIHHFNCNVSPLEQNRQRTQPLRDWLCHHRHNPYPGKTERDILSITTGLTTEQVAMWFANTRRRIKKVGMQAWSNGRYGDEEFHAKSLPASPSCSRAALASPASA